MDVRNLPRRGLTRFFKSFQRFGLSAPSHTTSTDSADRNDRVGNKEPPRPPKINMALIRICCCEDYGSDHLSVEIKGEELHESLGAAISYTWVEFNRQMRLVVHVYGRPAQPISLCLGAEWSVPAFMRRLIELTDEYGACWIDQLCLSQDDEVIRQTLVMMPILYGTLEVKVILPGPLCGCLFEAFDHYKLTKALFRSSPDQAAANEACAAAETELRTAVIGLKWVNSNGNCS